MPTAITRQLSPAITRCELTHLHREPIDVDLAAAQHEAYERCLERHGYALVRLAPEPDLPDAVFVEDTAVVVDELAVITRPGAALRRRELASVEQALAPRRRLARIEAPGTLDGGDVLRIGRRVLVGLTPRSNEDGIEQLRAHLAPHGYAVEAVGVTGCLHLKTGVTQVASDTVLLNPAWVDPTAFAAFRCLDVDPLEPQAANTLMLHGTVVMAAAYPRTRARLEAAGLVVAALDMTELAKAEGALTCCSLLLAD